MYALSIDAVSRVKSTWSNYSCLKVLSNRDKGSALFTLSYL